MRRNLGLVAMLGAGLVGGLLLRSPAVNAQGAAATTGPRYTVVQTDILSALVVDNSTNTVFFYTTEANAEPGADLYLRGSLDLTQVGQPTLKPKSAAKKPAAAPANP